MFKETNRSTHYTKNYFWEYRIINFFAGALNWPSSVSEDLWLISDVNIVDEKSSHDLLRGSRELNNRRKEIFLQIYHIETYHRFEDDHSEMSMEQLSWRNNKEAQEIMINHTEIFQIVSKMFESETNSKGGSPHSNRKLWYGNLLSK